MSVKVYACVGGTTIKEDISILKKGVHVVVGTPGKVQNMMMRGFIKTDSIRILILDEADEMLSRWFQPKIKEIFKFLPGEIQIALFSTTIPLDILKITKQFLRYTARILVKKEDLMLKKIKQYYIAIEKEEWKLEVLLDLYGNLDINQALIFCNTKKTANKLTEIMKEKDFMVSIMNEEMD
mmetsp:Transcript_25639/g.19396  ORF Transcript_25639/g.19396 Transcript_25639/m.19396 type:complete len:181 (-) Transcript_25639:196-738(-)